MAEGLEGEHRRQEIRALAAPLGRHRQALEADLGALPPQIARERAAPIAGEDVLVELGTRERGDRGAQQALLVCQLEVQLVPFSHVAVTERARLDTRS